MATQMQLRGGTTAENLLFTGAQRELTIDTDLNTAYVHDGVTAGGFRLASSADVDDGTFYYNEDAGSAADAYILVPKANTNVPSAYLDGVQFGFVTTHPNTGPSTANFQGLGVKNLKFAGGIDPLAGEISGRVYLIYDAANGWMEIQRKVAGAPPQLRTVGASVLSNAMTVTLAPCNIDFRAATLSNGAVNARAVTSTLSVVIPSGATLGTASAVFSRIVVVAIDNAGTVELAVINFAGGNNLDETALINTTAITAGSSASNVFYSTTARTGVPFRVMGVIGSTQPTAGTWSTSPSQIQGQGGQNIITPNILSGSAQATTSGTSIDFTGIPPAVKRITVIFNGVSTSGTSAYLIQLGSGAVDVATYSATSNRVSAGGTVAATYTTGFGLLWAGATESVSGMVTINLISGNTWIASGVTGSVGSTQSVMTSGTKTLSGSVDRVRLTTLAGTDTFDAGSVNIMFEV